MQVFPIVFMKYLHNYLFSLFLHYCLNGGKHYDG